MTRSKNKMKNQHKTESTMEKLEHFRKKDYTFSKGKILGSMCTKPHPVAKKAYIKFIETNLGDPKLFSGTKEIEKKYISFLSKLLNAPSTNLGLIGSGGTESNIVAVWIAKQLTKKKKIVISKNAHFSFDKIASLMDLKIETVSLDKKYCLKTDELEQKIDEDTAAVVAVAGSTELGTVDNIAEIGEICQKNNTFLHVDAAFGGYVIPFLKRLNYNVSDFDFKINGVSSISIDAHKMGCSVIPLGTLMLREKKWAERISVESDCVSTEKQAGILGTRPGASVAAAYAVADYLGLDGYQRIVNNCMKNTYYAVNRLEEIGLHSLIKPVTNVVGIPLNKPSRVAKRLEDYGWHVNIMDSISCIRLVLMPHVKKESLDSFIPDLKKACKREGEL